MLKKLIGVAIVVVLVAGAAFWWFVLRDDPPAELSVNDTSGSSSQTTTGTTPASLDGTWTVQAGDTTAGFRINESFAGGLADHTAVGRSGDVNGSIAVAGTNISSGDFTVNLSKLAFSDEVPGLSVTNRANALKSRGLQTSQFPEASFKLTEPIDFGSKPAEGETVTATATGDLTLHGVTKPVTFDVEAKIVGDTIRVATKEPVPIVLTDYGIDKPTGGPIASIDDQGSFEFLVVLGKS
ncbi:YceI family protein [Aquihabitans sp. McL0605]|uniref:YceI family protein n=1 Tax=Aquihabitans sp. McL0605 TaxID=3415671 RepID=UPI003CF2FE2F